MTATPFTYYEFFAGGGMARAGLGDGWECLFANDFDKVKAETYRANWGADHFHEGDVHALTPADLPGPQHGGRADLAWASSPCQDFSLAGLRKGLQAGTRSSAFWGFWSLMKGLNAEGRAPRVIVIENVVGLLTSHGGADFTALCQAFADEGYRFGALEIDAARFLPQSRPRLFVVATKDGGSPGAPHAQTHGRRICEAYARLPDGLKPLWSMSATIALRALPVELSTLLYDDDKVDWHSPVQTDRLLSHLSPLHLERLKLAQRGGAIGTLYRRTRIENGVRVQRSEIRFDGVAGCLRTPGGGSSRQFLVEARPNRVRTRALTPREGARLMGLLDGYRLPNRATAALHVVGDGVAVPVVRALAAQVLEPLLAPPNLAAAE